MHDVWVELQLLQHSDFSDGCARDSVVTVVNLDLLDGHDLSFLTQVVGLVNHTVGALTEL